MIVQLTQVCFTKQNKVASEDSVNVTEAPVKKSF